MDEYDPGAARQKATSIIKLNKTDDGTVTRMRIIEDYFTDEMLGNTALINEYVNNNRDNDGNFTDRPHTKTYQEALERFESLAIEDLVRQAAFDGKRQDDESGTTTNGLTAKARLRQRCLTALHPLSVQSVGIQA